MQHYFRNLNAFFLSEKWKGETILEPSLRTRRPYGSQGRRNLIVTASDWQLEVTDCRLISSIQTHGKAAIFILIQVTKNAGLLVSKNIAKIFIKLCITNKQNTGQSHAHYRTENIWTYHSRPRNVSLITLKICFKQLFIYSLDWV